MVEQCLACAGSGGAYQHNVKDDGALAKLGTEIKLAMLRSKELAVLLTFQGWSPQQQHFLSLESQYH